MTDMNDLTDHDRKVIEDFSRVIGSGKSRREIARNLILMDLIDPLSHVDESTDPVLMATRIIAYLQGDPNWETVEVSL